MRRHSWMLLLMTACTETTGSGAALTRIDPEFAGEHCHNGGLVIHEGTDLDGSGTLSDDEIERSTYQCAGDVPDDFQGLHLGDAIVRTAADLDALAGVDTITGDLMILGLQLDRVELPGLRVLGGRLVIGDEVQGTLLQQVSLPDLAVLHGGWELRNNPYLMSVVAPSLRDVGTAPVLILHENPLLNELIGVEYLHAASVVELVGDHSGFELQTLQLESALSLSLVGDFAGPASLLSLVDVAGDLVIAPPFASTPLDVALPALEHAGSLQLRGGSRVQELRAPLLTEVGGVLVIEDSPALARLDLDALATVAGDFDLLFAAGLQSLELPRLASVGGRMKLQDGAFRVIHMPSLESVHSSLWVSRNAALEQLDLGHLAEVGVWHTLQLAIEGNGALVAIALDTPRLDVDGAFILRNNPVLASVAAFEPLHSVTGNFEVVGSPLVDGCEVQALIDGLAADVGGSVQIDTTCAP